MRGCDVEGDQRAGRGDASRLQHQTILGFVVAEPDRLGIVQRGDAPASQRAQRITGARVGDTAVEDDVEIESAARRVWRRQIEHEIAIENRRDLDAPIAGRGEDRLLLGAQVGDEHAEPGGTRCRPGGQWPLGLRTVIATPGRRAGCGWPDRSDRDRSAPGACGRATHRRVRR